MPWGNGDFFVDSAATGTGSGDTPANAAINITSLFSSLTSAALGCTIWVRRTFLQPAVDTRSLTYGIFTGANSVNVNSHPPTWLVGWPNSGDPFYEERPVSAVSAGWDADVAPHMFWPSIVFSGSVITNGLRRNHALTNFTLVGSPNTSAAGVSDLFNNADLSYIGWLGYMQPMGTGFRQVEHGICCSSVYTTQVGIYADYHRKITITASCMYAGTVANGVGMIGRGASGGQRMEEIVNLSNSISILIQIADTSTNRVGVSIGRVRGIRPYSADVTYNTGAQQNPTTVDDYFGYPAIFYSRPMGVNMHTVSSAGVATFSGATRAMRTQCESFALTGTLGAVFMGGRVNHLFPLRQLVQATSGVPLHLRLQLAMANAGAVFDQHRGRARFTVPADGCGERILSLVNSGLQPGSASMWTGSLTGVQSYYMMWARFVPSETAVIQVAAMLPSQQVSSGATIYYPPSIEVASS